MLRIALQSKGRLNEKSVELLREAGIGIEENSRRLLSRSSNFPVEVLYLRDDDIPQTVSCGIADIGIVGLNEVKERNHPVEVLQHLGFGRCRLSLAIPKYLEYTGLEFFQGRKIATSYPGILAEWFREKNIGCEIIEIAGSVEISPSIGLSDGIFDIVSSGGTLVQNGLKEVETVMESDAVLRLVNCDLKSISYLSSSASAQARAQLTALCQPFNLSIRLGSSIAGAKIRSMAQLFRISSRLSQ